METIVLKNRVDKYRKHLGLTQHKLVKKVGVSRVSINKIEKEIAVIQQ